MYIYVYASYVDQGPVNRETNVLYLHQRRTYIRLYWRCCIVRSCSRGDKIKPTRSGAGPPRHCKVTQSGKFASGGRHSSRGLALGWVALRLSAAMHHHLHDHELVNLLVVQFYSGLTTGLVMVKPSKQYQCQRCSRTFARLEHLQRHDRSRMIPAHIGDSY